jgi:hypothetical protein
MHSTRSACALCTYYVASHPASVSGLTCMAEILRTAHGSNADALLVAERPPLDELPAPNAADTEKGLAEAQRRGRPFVRGNAAAKGRKPALARLGVDLDTADPRYKAALKRAERYRRHRVRELAVSHGGYLGAGPAAMLAASARAWAASTLLYTLAGELIASDSAKAKKRGADLLALAARLGDSARQQELTAVALAERESASRPADQDDVPWLVAAPAAPSSTKPSHAPSSSPERDDEDGGAK